MEKLKLKVISVTTRPGRVGPKVGEWMTNLAHKNSQLEVEFVDLGELNLPLMDEPMHPMMKDYKNEHTKIWSEKIEEADAFIFVTSEYNHSFPASLKNALDYLVHEWKYKAVGFVTYSGGISGGTRVTKDITEVVTALRMMPVVESVIFPFIYNYLDEKTGDFKPAEISVDAGNAMLAELIKCARALKTIRVSQ